MHRISSWIPGFLAIRAARVIGSRIQRILLASAVALVFGVSAIHGWLSWKDPYVNNFSNAEEWAYTNISAGNYLKFGFLNSHLLQDFSTSADREDHPFVYNHMPPGPDIATALVREATGNDLRLTRIFFALLVLPGIYYLVRFVALLTEACGRVPAAVVLLLAGPSFLIGQMEAQIHSAYLLLSFAPLTWALEYVREPSRRRLLMISVTLLLLSVYIQYVLVAGIVFAWIFLYMLRVVPIPRRLLFCSLGAVAAGVALHLVQNLSYLGPEIFARELAYTLGNRAFGVPTKEEIAGFYESIGVVHHGARAPRVGTLLATIGENMTFPAWRSALALMLLLSLVALLDRFGTDADRKVPGEPAAVLLGRAFRLFLWAQGAVICVIFLFPAFTQEVNLRGYGVNHLLYAIATTGLLSVAWTVGARSWTSLAPGTRRLGLTIVLPGVMAIVASAYVVGGAVGALAAVMALSVVHVSRAQPVAAARPIVNDRTLLVGAALAATLAVALLYALVFRLFAPVMRGFAIMLLGILPFLVIALERMATRGLQLPRPRIAPHIVGVIRRAWAFFASLSTRPLAAFRAGQVVRSMLVGWMLACGLAAWFQMGRSQAGYSVFSLTAAAAVLLPFVLLLVLTSDRRWMKRFSAMARRDWQVFAMTVGAIGCSVLGLPLLLVVVLARVHTQPKLGAAMLALSALSWLSCAAWTMPATIRRVIAGTGLSFDLRAAAARCRTMLAVGTAVLVVIVVLLSILGAAREFRSVVRQARQPNIYAGVEGLSKYRGELFMTNINVPVPAFFAQAPGYGVCGLQSIAPDGRPDTGDCKISYLRRAAYWRAQEPRYFYFFWKTYMFPGFADCLPPGYFSAFARGDADCVQQMQRRLSAAYPVVERNDLFEVYDLRSPLRPR